MADEQADMVRGSPPAHNRFIDDLCPPNSAPLWIVWTECPRRSKDQSTRRMTPINLPWIRTSS
jgi:hypothetical protein